METTFEEIILNVWMISGFTLVITMFLGEEFFIVVWLYTLPILYFGKVVIDYVKKWSRR